ncbi:MAG TPA: YihY/virulence factor BrkB family protein [Candidatus Limnocylindrales bacterium]|nr:YihY/virulence factor BrkB family protein [Candidatus Limnocylindrales bacterium]
MSPGHDEDDAGADRLRLLAEGITRRVGGLPAVRTLMATLTVYDGAGGGLMASGLAYAALVALLPGLLVMVSVLGIVIDDEATREALVALIATAVPPLEELARTAFTQVSAGAVPTGIIGFLGLLWGASRFYAALDYTFARIFHGARRRNEVERTLRGVVLTAMLVVAPLGALLVGSLAGWIIESAPGGLAGALWQLATPIGSFLLFVTGTVMVFRFVPGSRLPGRAYVRPAILVGLALAAFAQIFTFIAPLMTKVASIYGPFVAAFALLAWLSISFNVLLVGASWTRVRVLALGHPGAKAADPTEPGKTRTARAG